MIGLSYFNEEYGVPGKITKNILQIISTEISKIDFPNKEVFTKTIERICDGDFIENSGNKMQIIKLPYSNHAAYAIIDYEGDVAKKISFCDGNFPGMKRFLAAEISFDIDSVKLAANCELKKFIKKEFFSSGEEDSIYQITILLTLFYEVFLRKN